MSFKLLNPLKWWIMQTLFIWSKDASSAVTVIWNRITSKKIRKHIIREHSDNDCEVERLTCGECISNREDHQCHEDDQETKNFECNFCDLRLTTKTTHRVVVNHMKTHHPDQKLFHCNRCSFKCNWLYNLRSHKKVEHKIEAKKSDNLLETFSGIIGLFMKHAETQDSLWNMNDIEGFQTKWWKAADSNKYDCNKFYWNNLDWIRQKIGFWDQLFHSVKENPKCSCIRET